MTEERESGRPSNLICVSQKDRLMKPIAQQTILITGSTDGLGKQTALALARQGATVLLHGRNKQRLETTLQEIQEATGNTQVETYLVDFPRFQRYVVWQRLCKPSILASIC